MRARTCRPHPDGNSSSDLKVNNVKKKKPIQKPLLFTTGLGCVWERQLQFQLPSRGLLVNVVLRWSDHFELFSCRGRWSNAGLPRRRFQPKPNHFGTDHRSPTASVPFTASRRRLKDSNLLLHQNLMILPCDSCGCL